MEHNKYDELYDALTEEQKERLDACETPREKIRLLGELGLALPDELLDSVSGGVKYYTEEEAKALREYTHWYWKFFGCRCEWYRPGTTPKDGSCPQCGSGNVVYPFFGDQHVCMTCDWTWVVRA